MQRQTPTASQSPSLKKTNVDRHFLFTQGELAAGSTRLSKTIHQPMENYPARSARHRGLMQQFTPLNLSTDWADYSVVKARGVRVVALSGQAPYSTNDYTVENAVGCIEITGGKVGVHGTMLLIGFTLDADPPPPAFDIVSGDAIGMITLPAHCFAAYVAIANTTGAHFRLGGDGRLNALATDAASLYLPSAP